MIELDVVPGVHRIEDANVSWFLVEADHGRELTVVDAGVPTSWRSLQEALGRLGRTPDDLRALVLTHAHFDHVGIAERLRTTYGLPVHVHVADEPLSRHPMRYLHERPRGLYLVRPGALPYGLAFLANRAVLAPPVGEVTTFHDGDVLDVPGSPQVIACPGHTDGHVALHLPDRDVLIAGDAVVTLDPYTGRRGPRLVARAATADVARNQASLPALAATGARTVLVGHGPTWTGGVAELVAQAGRAGAA